jgi:hypothetical protein
MTEEKKSDDPSSTSILVKDAVRRLSTTAPPSGKEPPSPPQLTPKLKAKHDKFLFGSALESDLHTQQIRGNKQQRNHVSSSMDSVGDGHHESSAQEKLSVPQHIQNRETEMQYYQVVYRGVVALLSEPNASSKKSGAYVGYGEIIASEREILEKERAPSGIRSQEPKQLFPTQSSAERSGEDWQPESGSINPESTDANAAKIIRVDRVLTGGYAVDAVEPRVAALDQTPKRANTQQSVTIISASPMPIPDGLCKSDSVTSEHDDHMRQGRNIKDDDCHGYVMSHRNNMPIAVPIEVVPKMEHGAFLYKVVSSTPLPILTGPSLDAPTTKAMLIPGSTHDVCLRMYGTDSSVCFLRLTRRRGWIADQKISRKQSGEARLFYIMKEIDEEESVDDCNISMSSSGASSTVATPVSAARRRHRPPRRRRELKKDAHSHPPLHVLGPSHSQQDTPNNSFDTSIHDKVIKSPSSNVSSLLSEVSSQPSVKQMGSVTPDRSVARSAASSKASQINFFLMRVNAPRGLKILDAPHFQVNKLIHGNHPGGSNATSPLGMNDLAGQTTNQSIFQTMAGHHTTTLTSKIGNPAVFDSIIRARKLPRGSVFEASKRMENSGAFGEGAGLIKLSDNSGWAIVPKQEELDEHYRGYSGSLAGIKEGEATRAYEEVGNAAIEERQEPRFFRVSTKGGISVSCPPVSSVFSDDETSITSPGSSVAGASTVSAGFSHVTSQDSDIASSVGSSFIDAMFRTPKKKDSDHMSVDSRRDVGNYQNKGPSIEKTPFSTVIPCGMYVEVERWTEPADLAQNPHENDFARIRGGQGWIPRFVSGKPVVETIKAPDVRFGSFWFRVQEKGGIKVRLGPSRRSPSIKSDDGVYFRFECGEFLRASEVVTFFREEKPYESFAKLFRNRHVRLQNGERGVRQLASLTAQSEWVQIFGSEQLHLDQRATEPRIERHRQGWRYNVVLDARIEVRRGPSFEANPNGAVLLGGESVLINERVICPDENVTWLRLKDGQGWVHNVGMEGEALMIPHSLKHRKSTRGRQAKSRTGEDDIAYNTIIARLFHNDSENGPSRAQSGKR